ncbi:Mannosyl-oligosaccharide 1,2-alpha-mannosidase [Penicillium oxalicum]|uniref:Mannosyl-oligosaccharide 1,2-alpha-mannosidase n=1 Tax=Penicillium oxalicum TaxID=69781 RepID=UPI0020B7B4D2|nr:Mannosyl-oligosaccharide 1,2-alpha-mannosidase [Penicillium oxalicum]KAI2794152.1 Mannosyl-oligosaccharide 1,2-alpha-mannosidase [Penicillium oxalicum]
MRSARQPKRPPSPKSYRATRWRVLFGRNRVVQALLTGGVFALLAGNFKNLSNEGTVIDFFRPIDKDTYWESHREEVKDAFLTSWDAYSKYAWGYDVFHPISKSGSQMSPNGLGWIIVDSLDTLMIMNLTTQLGDARKWLHRALTYDQDQDVNTFETTIRMLGGLLSAHFLSTQLPHVSSRRDYIYLAKAIDLADRLLSAYESRSGIPYASVNLGRRQGLPSHADGGASSTAEATTLQLEMKYLAHLTGNEIYWRKAENVIKVIDDHRMRDGLVPIFVHPETGRFQYREIRLGSRGDSYYEYLIKQYLQTYGQEPIYSEMWEEALAGIQKHLVTTTKHSNLKFIAELPQGVGGKLSPKMDHLVCFLPGSIAIGATEGRKEAEARQLPSWNAKKEEQMKLAKELMKTCWAMYAVTESGLSPEIAWFEADPSDLEPGPASRPQTRSSDDPSSWKKDFIIKPLDAHNLQRPETVESLFLMFRVTNDPIYRKWGWKIFNAFQKHTLVPDGEGYTSLNDVTKAHPPQRDNMESFWLAETLKYLYLLFSPADFIPLTEVVFNTEAHVLPRFEPSKFKTGWSRKEDR